MVASAIEVALLVLAFTEVVDDLVEETLVFVVKLIDVLLALEISAEVLVGAANDEANAQAAETWGRIRDACKTSCGSSLQIA